MIGHFRKVRKWRKDLSYNDIKTRYKPWDLEVQRKCVMCISNARELNIFEKANIMSIYNKK